MFRFLMLSIFIISSTFTQIWAQNVVTDRESDKWVSYQVGSRMTESVPLQSDIIKAKFAERLSKKERLTGKFKSSNNGPVIGTNLKHYTPQNTGDNGLSNRFVRFVFEDAGGTLYFSTNGVDRWNGFEWDNDSPMNSGLPAFSVFDMVEDDRGNLWLATFEGLVRYNKDFEEYEVFNTDNSDIRSPLVYTLHKDKRGYIYAGHRYDTTFNGGITVFHPDGWVDRTISSTDGLYGDSIEDFVEDKDHNLYIATGADPENGLYGGINVWDMEGDSLITFYNMDNSGLPYNEVSSLEIDGSGNLWAGFYLNPDLGHNEGGVASFDGSTWTHYSQDKGNDVGQLVMDLLVDGNNTLWITANDGAYSYDGLAMAQVTGGDDDGYSLTNVSSATELEDGRIAFSKFTSGLDNGGVSILNALDNSWEHISTRDGGLVSQVYFGADYDSQGNLWATGFYGLQKFNGQEWELWTQKDGLESTYGWDLIVDQNDNVWVNSTDTVGLTRINADGTIEIIAQGDFVESNWEATNGDMWFGSWYNEDGSVNGMLQFDGTNYTVYDSTDGLPAYSPVVSIAEDQQGQIVAATYNGLYRLESGSFVKWEYDGYEGGETFKVHLDSQNRFWVNAGSKTSMYDGTDWTHFNIYDGVEGWVEDIEHDMAGRVWFAQPNGAVVYDNGIFHKIGAKDGYPQYGIGYDFAWTYDLAPSRTEADKMAFGTYRAGIVILDSELPITITSLMDNPNDQGGWIRVHVDGYLLSENYTGEGADQWFVQVWKDGEWESATPFSPPWTKSISVQVPVTKPTDESPGPDNSFDFRVLAFGDDVAGISQVVNGYAEDNIPPAQVQNFVSEKEGTTISLSWEPVDDNDLNTYSVYEASVKDFSETEAIVSTSATEFSIQDQGYNELVVVAVDDHNNYGPASNSAVITSKEDLPEVPDEFNLDQNYPNPFNPATRIRYDLPQNSHTRITVFNTLGQQVMTLVNEVKAAGSHEITFNADQLNSGMYIYRIEAGSFTQTRKMLLIK